jgi:hypothetical protein
MVLFGIVGELGAGKTLSLTFLAWKNWFYRRKTIYSNYHLYKIPYIYIDTVEKLDAMREGFAVLDEFWLWIDSRTTRSNKNKIVADILLKSRKRGLTWCFTAQLLDLLDKRVRKVMDFTAYPILNTAETICKVSIFRTGYPKAANYLKTFYFKTQIVFDLYNHREEIEQLEMETEDEDMPEMKPEMKIVFQESMEAEPMYFNSWAEADKHAEEYWKIMIGKVQGKI